MGAVPSVGHVVRAARVVLGAVPRRLVPCTLMSRCSGGARRRARFSFLFPIHDALSTRCPPLRTVDDLS